MEKLENFLSDFSYLSIFGRIFFSKPHILSISKVLYSSDLLFVFKKTRSKHPRHFCSGLLYINSLYFQNLFRNFRKVKKISKTSWIYFFSFRKQFLEECRPSQHLWGFFSFVNFTYSLKITNFILPSFFYFKGFILLLNKRRNSRNKM